MIGFAAIIFRNHAFHDDPATYAKLVKLVLFSSAVHQAVLVASSTLPFAIGQVQDAGLIFLAKMADDLVGELHERAAPPADVYATVLVTLSLSTVALGIALIVTGRMRLAGLVQFLPLPVVGGYLAFIGLYCLEAGISLMSGVSVTGLFGLDAPAEWAALLQPGPLVATLPGLAAGIGITAVVQRFDHFLVLPGLLVALPLGFFAATTAMGYSLEDLRDMGLVADDDSGGSLESPLAAWTLYDFSRVHWSLVPSVWPTWLGMYIVVAFSSSLDVAAIQMDMGKQLDFNHELATIGISNSVSGLLGGFTGSYIFSCTIFTYRTGTQSRLCGAVVSAAELLLWAAPFSVVAYVPKLFFGGVLTFIALDLLQDWLVQSRSKMHLAEYFVVLATFSAINLLGLEVGMLVGVAVSMTHFIFDYSYVPLVERLALRSNVIRSLPLSAALVELAPQTLIFRCRGYIFFGSTLQLMDEVYRSVVLSPEAACQYPHGLGDRGAAKRREKSAAAGISCASSSSSLEQAFLSPHESGSRSASPPGGDEAAAASGGRTPSSSNAAQLPTKFVLFDFSAVSGLDATAARACFLNLTRTLAPLGISLVFGGVPESGRIARLLRGHEIIEAPEGMPSATIFDTIDGALEYCEDELLRSTNLLPKLTGLEEAESVGGAAAAAAPEGSCGLRVSGAVVPTPGPAGASCSSGTAAAKLSRVLLPIVEASWRGLLEAMEPYFEEEACALGQSIFARGEDSHAIYFITSGEVTLWEPYGESERRRLLRYANGGIFGELDFFLHRRRSFFAEASSRDCTLLTLRRERLHAMQSEDAKLAAALQHALLKYLCFQVNYSIGIGDGAATVNARR